MSSWESAGNGRLGKGAEWYAKNGWKILPCHGIADGGRCTCSQPHGEPKDIGKHPAIGEWNLKATSDVTTVTQWWEKNPEYNIGVFCAPSGFLVIDIDPRSDGIESFDKFEELVDGNLPKTVEAVTGEYSHKGKNVRGRHIYYKCSPDEQLVGNMLKNGLKGIDIKHNGYVLIAPSRHFSGMTYDWAPGQAPWEIEMAEAPEELLQALRKRSRKSTSYNDGSWEWLDDLEFKGQKIDIERLLTDGIEEGSRAVDIYAMACALANKYGTSVDARMMVETMMIRFNAEKVRPPMELEGQNSLLMHVRRAMDFVAENPKENRLWPGITDWQQGQTWAQNASSPEAQAAISYGSAATANAVGNTVASLVESGMSVVEATSNGNLDVPDDVDAILEKDGGRPGRRSLTDTGNGRRLVDTYGSAIRYTPSLGWFHWDGQYWKPDAEDLEMQELAKRIPAIIASEVSNYAEGDSKQQEVIKWANQGKSNTRLANMLKSANSDPRIVVGVEQWDGNTHLLGVQNGVVDLRTGELLKGRPDLYITRRAPVAYTPGLRNVRWEQFIDYATGGDKELQDWIQRAAGYTLTGLSDQDVMFLVYGPPGSGKNTFVETIVNALGTDEYAGKLPSEIMAAGQNNNNNASAQYYMAELRGKRMVWIDELPESERLNENKIKEMTGSATIQGRSPGEKPFTFKAQGKLWVTTNHRPIINDDAMWRRLRPIPWSHVPESSDPDLKAYLSDKEGGLPAVLAWAVEGAIKYLGSQARDPLGWCTAVTEAADVYRKNEDRIGLFLDEETREAEGSQLAVKQLYSTYKMWSEERGERAMTQIAFHRKLQDRGLSISGQGAKAMINGRVLPPRAVPTGEVNWSDATRFAKVF
jgi:putative DNA primase/helicase